MSENRQFILMTAILVLIFGAYFGALALAGWYDRKEQEKRGEPPVFDERQRLARLRAGNHALYALLVFLLLWTVLEQFGCSWLGGRWSMLFCALLLAWGVWAADCIWNDGFISWKHKGASNTSAFTVLVMLLNLLNMTKSMLPFLFWCVDALLLTTVIVCKWRKEKVVKREEEP